MPALRSHTPAATSPTRLAGWATPRALLISLVVAGLLATALIPQIIDLLGLTGFGHWFLDSYALLAANDAVAAGLNPHEPVPFDILQRPHVYSDWWLGLRWLGLTRADNFLFGGLCVLAYLSVALAGARPRSHPEALGFAALLLSPPMLLAAQRANNDLVIFTLIGAPLLLLHRSLPPWKLVLLAAGLVAATGLKYYPVVAIAALALLPPSAPLALRLGGGTLAAAAIILWSERASIPRGALPIPDSPHIFGSPVVWRVLGLTARLPVLALSLGLLLVAAFWLARRGLTRGLRDASSGHDSSRWSFAIGALILLGCFLAGTSFAYRWVFALWLWPWLQLQACEGPRPLAAQAARVLLLAGLWADGLVCLLLNLRGIPMSPSFDFGWRLLVHSTHWALMALLAGWLLDAALSALRELLPSRSRNTL